MPWTSDPDNGPAGARAQPFSPLSPGEIDALWDVELLKEEQATIDASAGADPALRAELAPILRTLDYDRRELFISALARLLERSTGGHQVDLAAAAREALESTRHATFLLALADQHLGGRQCAP